jgi:hypothetical protein
MLEKMVCQSVDPRLEQDPKKAKKTRDVLVALALSQYGKSIDRPWRWLWFSALAPYMTWKRGALNWEWLSSWVEVIEGKAPGDADPEGTLRKWWEKTLKLLALGSGEIPALSRRVKTNTRDYIARRRIARHFTLMRLLDGAWAYIRYERGRNRPCRPAVDITDILVMDNVVKAGTDEWGYVSKGLLKAFGFLKVRNLRQRGLQDYYAALPQSVGRLRPIPPRGYIEVVPK